MDHFGHCLRFLLQVELLLLLLLFLLELLIVQSPFADLDIALKIILLLLGLPFEVLGHADHLLEDIIPVSHPFRVRVLGLDFLPNRAPEVIELISDGLLLLLKHGQVHLLLLALQDHLFQLQPPLAGDLERSLEEVPL